MSATVLLEFDFARLAAFHHFGTQFAGPAYQDFVKFGAAHLVGVRHGFIQAFANSNSWRRPSHMDTNSAPHFSMPMARTLLSTPKRSSRGKIGRQKGFADVEAGMAGLLQNRTAVAHLRQRAAAVDPRRTSTDHQDIKGCLNLGTHAAVYRADKHR